MTEDAKIENSPPDDIEDEAGIKEHSRRTVRAAKAMISDGVDALESVCAETVDRVRSVVADPSRIATAARGIVRDHPLAAIAAVAVVSIALSRAISRR